MSAVITCHCIADKMISTRLTIIAFLAAAWCWTSDGQFYDVACPGVNSELKCPEGHVIEVLSLESGDKSSVDCAARAQPAQDTHDNCLLDGVFEVVQFICDKMERCRLPKPQADTFMCSDDPNDNFVQISYNCNKKRADLRTVVACEGQTADIKCEKGVLNIVKASFGRFDETTCTETPSKGTYCASYKADKRVNKLCERKEACKITANPEILGEPKLCDRLPKYLTVDYVCE